MNTSITKLNETLKITDIKLREDEAKGYSEKVQEYRNLIKFITKHL